MVDVLVTMRFGEALLDRVRAVSPRVRVTRADPETADYSAADVLYAGTVPRDLAGAPRLEWVQLHMAVRFIDGRPLLNLVERARGY